MSGIFDVAKILKFCLIGQKMKQYFFVKTYITLVLLTVFVTGIPNEVCF